MDGACLEERFSILDKAIDLDCDIHNGAVLINSALRSKFKGPWASVSILGSSEARTVRLISEETQDSPCSLSPILHHNLLGNKAVSANSPGILKVGSQQLLMTMLSNLIF